MLHIYRIGGVAAMFIALVMLRVLIPDQALVVNVLVIAYMVMVTSAGMWLLILADYTTALKVWGVAGWTCGIVIIAGYLLNPVVGVFLLLLLGIFYPLSTLGIAYWGWQSGIIDAPRAL